MTYQERNYIIDISTPETLERDFYAWLNGEIRCDISCLKNFPQIRPKAAEQLSDAYFSEISSSGDSRPSSISSDSNEYKYPIECEVKQAAVIHQQRSSGTNQLGRTYNPGLPLSMTEREHIVTLYNNGWKICDISKRLCVTHSCVSKILNRYRMTGSVKPKDAKEGKAESPLVTAIRDYKLRLGITRQSEIRKQLILDGICTRENAPSRSSINHILRTKLDLRRRNTAGQNR
uniref:Paired domain-containing protein n=1 Tax=Syphacia muris TaxID=451379 RepID=A0A0N5AIP4_9BILA